MSRVSSVRYISPLISATRCACTARRRLWAEKDWTAGGRDGPEPIELERGRAKLAYKPV